MKIIETIAEYDALLKENKSVFVDFYADWCGPCKMAAPVVEALSEEYPEVKFVKVNVDDLPEIAGQYGIMSIPTMIAFKNGEPAATSLGFKPKDALAEVVKAAL
jgi:thioredoxin 1